MRLLSLRHSEFDSQIFDSFSYQLLCAHAIPPQLLLKFCFDAAHSTLGVVLSGLFSSK